MDIASLFLRALDQHGDVYMPYEFCGDSWRDEDKAIIDATIKQFVPERVDAMFNNWKFLSSGDKWFYAMRATWDRGGLGGSTAQELAQKISEYYTR